MSRDSVYATSPFNHAKADVILRSSNNIDFRVFKLFLSLASPFFETLFDIPQPAQPGKDQEIKDGLVVIAVTEDSKTLDALLRFCYPYTLADDPSLDVLEDIFDVLQAARKYSFDMIEKKVVHALSNPKNLEAEPLRCFAIARGRRMQEETLLAAKYTLTQPLTPSWFEEIDLITAADFLALFTYHRECGDAAYALRTDMSWIKSHYGSSQGCAWLSGKYADGPRYPSGISYRECPCPRSSKPKYKLFESYSLQWWEDFMEDIFATLRETPCGSTVANLVEKTIQNVKSRDCPNCFAHIAEGVRSFSELLARKVEEVSRIKLDFPVPRTNQVHSESGLGTLRQGGPKRSKRRR